MRVEEWLNDRQVAVDIWTKKYQANNETFDEWLDRISGGNAAIRQLIAEKKFLFGGRILANRGLDKLGQKVTLSNCYVTSVDDSIESIFGCAAKLARTFSYGGGVGIDISKLAPRGAMVRNTAKKTSGAVSFMDLFSLVTGLIGQNGRRGALMISLDCDHPDIEEFIEIKSDLNRVTKANISIRITNEFMRAVKEGTPFTLSYKRNATGEIIEKEVDARALFKKIAAMNWSMGEPGMLFWDTIKSWNMLASNEEFEFAGVNPCAEQPLPAGGSCLLGSLNLSEFVLESFTPNATFDYLAYSKAVKTAVQALDEVLDEGLLLHPLEEQRKSVEQWRQIGLGVMGVADMLIKLGVRYGSEQAVTLCSRIAKEMLNNALQKSAELARKHGPYPQYCKLVGQEAFLLNNADKNTRALIEESGLRHSQLLTIAPTGSISTMLGISGGIEPCFDWTYVRTTETLHDEAKDYDMDTPVVKEYMRANGISDVAELPGYFNTAGKLNPMERIAMQAAWQERIDASISSTVNLPETATIEDVEAIYMQAWESGLKGITVFRAGCDRAGILNSKKPESQNPCLRRGDIVDASDDVLGQKRKLITGCGSLHCTAFFDPNSGELQETYFSKGSTGGCNNFMVALSRLISLAARSGCSVDSIFDQLQSCGSCPSYAVRHATQGDTSKGGCCPAAIGNALMDMALAINGIIFGDAPDEDAAEPSGGCPECGQPLHHSGGCNSCPACGYSKCE